MINSLDPCRDCFYTITSIEKQIWKHRLLSINDTEKVKGEIEGSLESGPRVNGNNNVTFSNPLPDTRTVQSRKDVMATND